MLLLKVSYRLSAFTDDNWINVFYDFYTLVFSMVGYNAEDEHRLNDIEHAIAGACSGMVTRFVCQPLDVLKIRFQVNMIQ